MTPRKWGLHGGLHALYCIHGSIRKQTRAESMNKITGMTQNGTKITYKFKATGLLMYPYEISYSYNGRKWYVDGYAKTDAEAKVNAAALLKVQVDQFNAMSKGL